MKTRHKIIPGCNSVSARYSWLTPYLQQPLTLISFALMAYTSGHAVHILITLRARHNRRPPRLDRQCSIHHYEPAIPDKGLVLQLLILPASGLERQIRRWQHTRHQPSGGEISPEEIRTGLAERHLALDGVPGEGLLHGVVEVVGAVVFEREILFTQLSASCSPSELLGMCVSGVSYDVVVSPGTHG